MTPITIEEAVRFLMSAGQLKRRNLFMPGDGRYQPEALRPFFGYDQWAGWCIIVEWFWMQTLADLGEMPQEDAQYLVPELLNKMLRSITTTMQDKKEKGNKKEKGTNHDILALLALMREHLPEPLHRWLHFGATSYDIISTAYALQLKQAFTNVFLDELWDLDELWREKIRDTAEILQAGRTHLQTALPVTVGCWLANLHNRFAESAREALVLVRKVPGKFSGAVGTYASQRALLSSTEAETRIMEMLGLPAARVSTQIAPPEGMARFYHELVMLSGALANLGEDTRILQSSQFGEIVSASSGSSAMSHKTANPIAGENVAGMHMTVVAEYQKVLLTLVSDLQRDLRGSSVMRSYCAVAVYVFQQILTAKRLLGSMKVNEDQCMENLGRWVRILPAEVLHLALQREGFPDAHHFVNQQIVPEAFRRGARLDWVMDEQLGEVQEVWNRVPPKVRLAIEDPKSYIGDAVLIGLKEAENSIW